MVSVPPRHRPDIDHEEPADPRDRDRRREAGISIDDYKYGSALESALIPPASATLLAAPATRRALCANTTVRASSAGSAGAGGGYSGVDTTVSASSAGSAGADGGYGGCETTVSASSAGSAGADGGYGGCETTVSASRAATAPGRGTLRGGNVVPCARNAPGTPQQTIRRDHRPPFETTGPPAARDWRSEPQPTNYVAWLAIRATHRP